MRNSVLGTYIDYSANRVNRKVFSLYRERMLVITFLSDLFALVFSVGLVNILVYKTFQLNYHAVSGLAYLLFIILCLCLFMTSKLYPGIGLNPAVEMKNVIELSAVSFLVVFGFLVLIVPLWTQDKLALLLIGCLSGISSLALRWIIRIWAVQVGFWGEPVVIVADREKIEGIVSYFQQRRRLGFLPVLGVTETGESILDPKIQVIGVDEILRMSDESFVRNGVHTVLISTAITARIPNTQINQVLLRKFKRLIFVSDMDWLEGVSITYHDFEGMLGMEARQNFLSSLGGFSKRVMDILIALVLGMISIPISIIAAISIKLDSPGPVFFQQPRVGKNGQKINIYKFRTMYVNAESFLDDYFTNDPEAKREWQETQKLRNDPRITRVGRWLRRFSIDELPQLLNVLMGDMSIVGPRPILVEQKKLYKDGFNVYISVRPGLTGFWQVSGRNGTSFYQRTLYDVYYVRNWSIWLDIYILLRTVWVVLSRDGAY